MKRMCELLTTLLVSGWLYTGCLTQVEAQNPMCPTRPFGTSDNSCASTAFVQAALAGYAPTITVGTTPISGGANTRILYDNSGILGEYTITGTGTVVAMQTAPTFLTSITTPIAYGGSAVGSSLTLQSTSNGAPSGSSVVLKAKTGSTLTLSDIANSTITINDSIATTGSQFGTWTGSFSNQAYGLVHGVNWNFTMAGSGGPVVGFAVDLFTGTHTGTSGTWALVGASQVNTGADNDGYNTPIGVLGIHLNAATTGNIVGVGVSGQVWDNSTKAVGVWGLSQGTNTLGIGVVGTMPSVATTRVGGLFEINTATGSLTGTALPTPQGSAALIASNGASGASTDDLILGQNGTAVRFKVDSNGTVYSGKSGATQGAFAINGSTSGTQTWTSAAAANGTITFPAGTVNFSATGGTSQVVKQTIAGGIFTVAQLAFTDISGTCATSQGCLGLTAAAVGDLIYASATTPTWARLADVATGSVLVSGGVNTAPAWSANPTVTSITTTSTGAAVTFADNGYLSWGGTNAFIQGNSATPQFAIGTSGTNRVIVQTGVFIGGGVVDPGSGGLAVTTFVLTKPLAVTSLATCNSGNKGARAFVTDSNAASYTAGIGAVVANGGTTNVPVVCDGTNWRIG